MVHSHQRLIPALFALLAFALLAPSPALADPMQPNRLETMGLVEVLKFRGAMVADPQDTMAGIGSVAARESLQRITGYMEEMGSGPSGWRFLLGASVFTGSALNEPAMLVVFYNPFIDAALFTEWRIEGDTRTLADIEWVPGDLVRSDDPTVDLAPLWMRSGDYPPAALADAVVDTVAALERRFGDAFAAENWRGLIGVEDISEFDAFLSPIVAARLFESQLRLAALATPKDGEDPHLAPLRQATVGVIETAAKDGFAPLLEQADETSEVMRAALSAINPLTMQGLSPVAYVVGEGQVIVFLSSILTTDFTIAARFEEQQSGYNLRQLEFIPWAATYQAAEAMSGTK